MTACVSFFCRRYIHPRYLTLDYVANSDKVLMSKPFAKNPIRICFVCPKVYPLFDPACTEVFGGAEVDLYNLGTELAKDPLFEVSYVTADYGQEAEVRIDGVRLIRSLDFKKGRLSGALRLWRAMKKAAADIYMIETASPGVPLTAAFCRLHDRRFVYRSAHQDDCDGTYLRMHPIVGRAYVQALRHACLIVTQNESDRDNLAGLFDLESVVIANGHRLPPVVDGPRKTILWVGRTAQFKHPERFVDLARRLPSEEFVMICQQATGDESYETLVHRAAEAANLTFAQRVPYHAIGAYFQAARVLVNTSDAEGFPNTFIEACKWGVPILSLNVNPDGFLDHWSCGICCSGDEDRLAKKLQYLLEDDRYAAMGRNGRKYAEADQDIAKIVDRYKGLFAGLVSRRD
jgi:glycosyltransferase involved in cell wall biosynthesis